MPKQRKIQIIVKNLSGYIAHLDSNMFFSIFTIAYLTPDIARSIFDTYTDQQIYQELVKYSEHQAQILDIL